MNVELLRDIDRAQRTDSGSNSLWAGLSSAGEFDWELK